MQLQPKAMLRSFSSFERLARLTATMGTARRHVSRKHTLHKNLAVTASCVDLLRTQEEDPPELLRTSSNILVGDHFMITLPAFSLRFFPRATTAPSLSITRD